MSSDETHLTRSVPLTPRPAEVCSINWILLIQMLGHLNKLLPRAERGRNFTSFSHFQKRTFDSSPTSVATASPQHFGQSDANKSSPVPFCHTPGGWKKNNKKKKKKKKKKQAKKPSKNKKQKQKHKTKQKNFTIHYSIIRIANHCPYFREQGLSPKKSFYDIQRR